MAQKAAAQAVADLERRGHVAVDSSNSTTGSLDALLRDAFDGALR
jgi:hypothetical protein